MVRLLKLYLELGHYRCINNEYTPKNGGFFWKKTMKAYFKAVILSPKIYENTLKLNFLIRGIRHTDCLRKFFKTVIYRCKKG